MKFKLPFIISLIAFLFFSWRLIDVENSKIETDYPSLEIRMREIGHQLLLKAGDSTSRVLPVLEKSKGAFTIRFENSLFIEPDTLVKIVKTSMADLHVEESYIVQVESCLSEAVVYGFEIHQQGTKDIVPCVGRSIPSGCYEINVLFREQPFPMQNVLFLALSTVICFAFGVLIFRNHKNRDVNEVGNMMVPLGSIRFYPGKQLLKTDANDIELTAKENHVL